MLFHSGLVVLRQVLFKLRRVFEYRIQDTPLAIDPAFFALAEEAIEEPVRKHLGRESPFVTGPAHIALDALAEGFLGDSHLQRAETRVAADLGSDGLVDGRAAGAAPGEARAGHEAAHGVVMAVAGSRQSRRGIVESAEDVNIVAKLCQGRQAGRQMKIAAGLFGNPITLRDAVAVEPQDEAVFDRRGSGIRSRVGGSSGVEHRNQRRQTHRDCCSRRGEPPKEAAAGNPISFSD